MYSPRDLEQQTGHTWRRDGDVKPNHAHDSAALEVLQRFYREVPEAVEVAAGAIDSQAENIVIDGPGVVEVGSLAHPFRVDGRLLEVVMLRPAADTTLVILAGDSISLEQGDAARVVGPGEAAFFINPRQHGRWFELRLKPEVQSPYPE